MSTLKPVVNFFQNVFIFSWDFLLALGNLVSPQYPEGELCQAWPEFVPPTDADSRSSCPALNALANHGILPHNGRNIKFTELNQKVRETYNFSSSFCFFVPNFAANMLGKSYGKDTFDLAEIDKHNGIEHDASLLREDVALVPDQGRISRKLAQELISSATGKDSQGNRILTAEDLSRSLSRRRVESRAANKDYTLAFQHRMFSSSNAATLLTIFGGRVDDIRNLVLEEKLSKDWEPRYRKRFGLTFAAFNFTVAKVGWGINEKNFTVSKNAEGKA